jgi:hypothetical protein
VLQEETKQITETIKTIKVFLIIIQILSLR